MRMKAIAAAVAGAATALAVAERRVAVTRKRRRVAEHRSELVDEAGRESFPASDPPGWTLGQNRD